MKYIISGTNRVGSRSLIVSEILKDIYKDQNESVEIISLADLPLNELAQTAYGKEAPKEIRLALEKINQADGLHVVVPEYNGSYPGALKLFIDHWSFPDSFEQRAVSFVGFGGIFGGLRPVEHLQQVFGYRNAFIFPHRVFIRDVFKNLDGKTIKDPLIQSLLVSQVVGFQKFATALQSQKLDANSLIQHRLNSSGVKS